MTNSIFFENYLELARKRKYKLYKKLSRRHKFEDNKYCVFYLFYIDDNYNKG